MSDALEKGIAIEKANMFGDPRRKAEAIEYFKQALLENPREVQAWGGIVAMTDNDNATKKYCLRKMLEIDPHNEGAKIILDFILETEPNFKWIKEQVSPLQPFFDSLQRAQTPSTASQPPWLNQANQPPRPNQPYRPTAPNFGSGSIPKQDPRSAPAQTSTKTKSGKKRMSPWFSSFLVFSVLIGIISIILGLTSSIFAPLLNSDSNPLASSPLFSGIIFFIILYIFLGELYWMISGYVGVYNLIKKGYLVEFLGCSLILAGIPLILPLFLGPILYWWADRIREKH